MTLYANHTGAILKDIVIPKDMTYTDATDPSKLTIQMKKKHEKDTVMCDTFTECPKNIFKPYYKQIECPKGICSADLCCEAPYVSEKAPKEKQNEKIKDSIKDISADLAKEMNPLFQVIAPTLKDWVQNFKIKTMLEKEELAKKMKNRGSASNPLDTNTGSVTGNPNEPPLGGVPPTGIPPVPPTGTPASGAPPTGTPASGAPPPVPPPTGTPASGAPPGGMPPSVPPMDAPSSGIPPVLPIDSTVTTTPPII